MIPLSARLNFEDNGKDTEFIGKTSGADLSLNKIEMWPEKRLGYRSVTVLHQARQFHYQQNRLDLLNRPIPE